MEERKYYLAIDIGASSGRHMLGYVEDGEIKYEEIYRFPNKFIEKDGHKCWDIEGLVAHVIEGICRCTDKNIVPESVGIDTWAVDYVLLDKSGGILGDSYAYRDDRTKGCDKLVYDIINESELYGRTGIQKQMFNTIYQLMAVKRDTPEYLYEAVDFLMIPDYINYRLSGVKANEYTNATSTQLINPSTKDWDYELINMLGYNSKMFKKPVKPGTILGELLPDIQKRVGFNCKVVAPATHDTGSAVAAVPYVNRDTAVYISSGTWSLMGIERREADTREVSRLHNFTNEGGVDYSYRYLKNIMGLWMIQSVKREEDDKYSFAKLCEMAKEADIDTIIDCNDERFLAPENMEDAIKDYCRQNNLREPETVGEIAAVIYNSLAVCYKTTIEEIEALTGMKCDTIHIVGGGANANYLNELTEKYTGRKVITGPSEATAIGNLKVQIKAMEQI